MANVLYTKGKENLLSGNIDLVNDTIKCALVDTGVYTANLATDNAWDDVSAGSVATETLTTTAVTDGEFTADGVTYSALSGNSAEVIVIYKDSGTPATSWLIAYIDTAGGTLPVTPNGGDVTITWDPSPAYIFAL